MGDDWVAWTLKWGLTAGLTGISVLLRGLFVRVRHLESQVMALDARPPSDDAAAQKAMAQVQDLRLAVAEHYVRRDDYIPQISEVLSRLDGIGTIVTRVEERQMAHERLHEHRPG